MLFGKKEGAVTHRMTTKPGAVGEDTTEGWRRIGVGKKGQRGETRDG